MLPGGEARIRTGGKGFAGLCLTTCPLRRKRTVKNGPEMQWSGQRGSNPRPQPWQGCALPTEPLPQKVEATTGIEPVIKALQASALPLGHVASHARLGEKSRLGKPAPYIQWSGRRGSNPRPQPWQGCALPTEPLPRAQADTIKEGCGLCKKKFEKSRPCTDPDPGRCMLAAKKLKKGLARICGCCIVSPRR